MKITAELSLPELQRVIDRTRALGPKWKIRPTYETGSHDLEGSANGFAVALVRRYDKRDLFMTIAVRKESSNERVCSETYAKGPGEEWRPDKERADLLGAFIDQCAIEAAAQVRAEQDELLEIAKAKRGQAVKEFFSN